MLYNLGITASLNYHLHLKGFSFESMCAKRRDYHHRSGELSSIFRSSIFLSHESIVPLLSYELNNRTDWRETLNSKQVEHPDGNSYSQILITMETTAAAPFVLRLWSYISLRV